MNATATRTSPADNDKAKDEKAKALQAALAQIEKQFGSRTSRSFPPARWAWTLPWAWVVCRAAV